MSSLLNASRRCACILAALLSLLGSTPAGASERPCFQLLSRASHLASSGESLSEDALVRAVFTAWESLFEESVVSAPDLQGWHGAGIESAKSWKYWLSPPEERLTSDLREGFEQLRGMVDSLLASVPDPRAIEAGLLDAFEQFASREEKRQESKREALLRRGGQSLAVVSSASFNLGWAQTLNDVAELADGRLVLAGQGDRGQDLVFLDQGQVFPIALPSDTSLRQYEGLAANVTPLRSGGFVVATFSNHVGFFSASGELLREHSPQSSYRFSGNRSRAVEAVDGTIAYVDQLRRLSLFHPGGEPKGDPIELREPSNQFDILPLKDGNLAVSSDRRLRIFDTAGNPIADLGAGWVSNQPLELSNGAIAVSFAGGFLRLLRLHDSSAPGAYRASLVEEFSIGFDRRVEGGLIHELESGRIALECMQGGKPGLLFVDRLAGTGRFVDVAPISGTNAVVLPNGGLALNAQGGLVLLDAEGNLVSEMPATAGSGGWMGSPVVFRIGGARSDEWGVASVDHHHVIAVDPEGEVMLREQLVFPQRPQHTVFRRLQALSNGSLLTLDSRGAGRVFTLDWRSRAR